ncbi:CoA transferase subunit A [Haladaptatus sp. NG-SE-30]
MTRNNLLTDVDSVVDEIDDGDVIAIGGFLTSHKPMAFIREIVRRELSGLTVVAPPTSLETDLLIATECVDTIWAPYVGAEGIASIAPWYRHRAETGDITVKETDGGMIIAALEAAERNLPFMPWRGGVGTAIPERNEDVVVFEDPLEDEPLVAVPAIQPDVALLHLARGDSHGNVQAIGDTFADGLIARAASQTFVQVEEVVATDEIRQAPKQTIASFGNVDGVVEAPWGAHPFSCKGHYLADTDQLEAYVAAAADAVAGDSADWEIHLEKYVYRPTDHASYVDHLGTARRTSLREYGGVEA